MTNLTARIPGAGKLAGNPRAGPRARRAGKGGGSTPGPRRQPRGGGGAKKPGRQWQGHQHGNGGAVGKPFPQQGRRDGDWAGGAAATAFAASQATRLGDESQSAVHSHEPRCSGSEWGAWAIAASAETADAALRSDSALWAREIPRVDRVYAGRRNERPAPPENGGPGKFSSSKPKFEKEKRPQFQNRFHQVCRRRADPTPIPSCPRCAPAPASSPRGFADVPRPRRMCRGRPRTRRPRTRRTKTSSSATCRTRRTKTFFFHDPTSTTRAVPALLR